MVPLLTKKMTGVIKLQLFLCVSFSSKTNSVSAADLFFLIEVTDLDFKAKCKRRMACNTTHVNVKVTTQFSRNFLLHPGLKGSNSKANALIPQTFF